MEDRSSNFVQLGVVEKTELRCKAGNEKGVDTFFLRLMVDIFLFWISARVRLLL
jgi:hypothetical protein